MVHPSWNGVTEAGPPIPKSGMTQWRSTTRCGWGPLLLKFAKSRQGQPFLFFQGQERHRRQWQELDRTMLFLCQLGHGGAGHDALTGVRFGARKRVVYDTPSRDMFRKLSVSPALTDCSTLLRVVYGRAGRIVDQTCLQHQLSPTTRLR